MKVSHPQMSGALRFLLLNNRKILHRCLLFIMLSGITAMVSAQTISGRVASGDSSLSNVTVALKGSKVSTQTDGNGMFTIAAPANGTLVFTSIGFESMEMPVNNRSNLTINLVGAMQQMNEVVVVGYGTQKKATLTGAVSTVKGSEILKSPAMNVSNSLGGRLPGLVTITPSGEPGADGSILRIRGVNTLGNNNPLIVVDGIPGRSLDRIDPSTIESITVLKDASAAIYGAQAANGVILITTKRGSLGKPTITASFNQGFGRPTVLPKMADAATYATMINEINEYAGRTAKYTPEDIRKYTDGSDQWTHPNTNWFDEVLQPWAGLNYANVTVNGGSENVRYFVSLSSRTQQGFYHNSGVKYNQYDFRSNLDANVNKNITLSFDVAGRLEDRNFPTRSAGSIFRMVMRGKPNETAYWPNGLPGPDIEYGDNPVVVSTKATGYDHDKRYVLNSNGKINIKIPFITGLSLTGNVALDKSFNFRKIWQTPWFLHSWDGVTRDAGGTPVLEKSQKGFSSPALSQSSEDNQNILLNGLLNYETKIRTNHNVKFLIGAEKITGKGENINAYRRNFLSPNLDQLFAGAQDLFLSNGGSAYTQARLNYFGRVNYNFKEKYLAEFVWRYQGSYIFPEAKRFGFFPGVSLGYKISDEKFWQDNLRFINTFKLRASWGRTGNDQIDEWQYLSTYGFGGIRAQPWNPALPFITNGIIENPTLYETVVPNPLATWETANQSNIGFDATLLKNKLSVTADYFSYKRSGILIGRNASIPTTAGFTPPKENIGRVSNRGFDFGINYSGSGRALTYQIGINGGYQKNQIDFWDEPAGRPEHQASTGYPIGSTLYYEAIGIFATADQINKTPHLSGARPGDVIFKDYNNDGKIDALDQIRIQKSDIPTFTGGITLALKYKNFDFNTLIQGATGAVRYISTESGEIGNYLQSFAANRWTSTNPNASGPRTFNRGNEYWVGNANTFWLLNTDYVRLKNIEIGYTIPASVLGRTGIQNTRVYMNAMNLLTYASQMKDFDPELGNGNGQGYPLQKIINFGVAVTF